LRVPLRISSVGHAARLYGKALRSYLPGGKGWAERGKGGPRVRRGRRRQWACAGCVLPCREQCRISTLRR
jgi:hypothetical protein